MADMHVTSPETDLRHRAHDLRNLFGAVAAARHMLDSGPDEPRRRQILAALGEAARRGDALTTRLLASRSTDRTEALDPGARLKLLEPLLRTIADGDNHLSLEFIGGPGRIRAVPEHFDHVIIELVANACHALARPGSIRIRMRTRRGRARIMIADTGAGMSPARCRALLTSPPTRQANGTGFQQVRRFSREAHGRLALRSLPGKGSVVILDLPILLGHR